MKRSEYGPVRRRVWETLWTCGTGKDHGSAFLLVVRTVIRKDRLEVLDPVSGGEGSSNLTGRSFTTRMEKMTRIGWERS